MATKISIINQKGGAGKTSFAVLCCLALAEKGNRVLAIDCDPQGGMSEMLRPDEPGTLHSGLMGDYEGLTRYTYKIKDRYPMYENLQVITSSYELDKLYVTIDHLAFKRTLKNIEADYDYIVFDTPPTMQGITRAAAYYSDLIFVPTEISKNAIGPTLYTLKCLEELDKSGNVVFVDGAATTKYKKELKEEYELKVSPHYSGMIKKSDTAKKIISGEIQLTDSKIKEYLEPVFNIINKESN